LVKRSNYGKKIKYTIFSFTLINKTIKNIKSGIMYHIKLSTTMQTEFVDVTPKISNVIKDIGLQDGVLLIYSPHTTAGITINEGADPAVKRDILHTLNKLIPWDDGYHHLEGNSAAHIKTSIMGSGVNVAVENGKLCLGTWQKIFFCEFDGPRNRKVWIKAIT
jgi:secondary thiamine-phosphate synthase enzyme